MTQAQVSVHSDNIFRSMKDMKFETTISHQLAQINRFGGNISRTAAFIGMERSALHRKLKSLGINTGGRSDDVMG